MDQILGVYDAVVIDADDPQALDRARLMVPQIHGDAVTDWAVPVGQSTPVAGDRVSMAYAGGDQNFPVYWPPRPWVSSVNGYRGDVELTSSDVGALNVTGADALYTRRRGLLQTPSYAANWVDGGGFGGLGGTGLRFYLDGDDNVWLTGLAHANTGAGTTVFTLPNSTYFPLATRSFFVGASTAANVLSISAMAVTTTGAVILAPAAVGSTYSFNVKVYLGNRP